MPQSPRAALPVRILASFNGPQTLGNSRFFWCCWLVAILALALLPCFASRYHVLTASNFLISSILALSLCLIWGYCGILSLGQAAFFGVGGYAYGIVGINLIEPMGNTDLALLAGVLAPAAFAACIGGLMFYSRLKGVYVAILMLVVSLLLGLFMRQTADPSYTIGGAYLGGMNGLGPATASDPALPSLTLGLAGYAVEFDGRGRDFYWFVLGVGIAVYLGLRWLVNSSFGYLLVACREDLQRTETFGYDVRLVQLGVFCLSAALAGLSGALYTAWGAYIHPDGFSVAPNILVVIWVAVGGRKDLTSVVVSTLALNAISIELAAWGEISLLALGVILVTAMLAAPEGVAATLGAWIGGIVGRKRAGSATSSVPARLGAAL
ncbi:branched-chain amino acid ABC transporter permease [Hansschlegelia plantiphila]|uniref:Branched-chain amino acid ABC transporter permease n=1 Tax=Hansschlegelia plantiphila TaxID=374655 RepID=A0A9W6IXE8_9HYPH|nr:branched-chain amino acid ABC transporter permease [Hansschlegelia plantiphila]GLK66916.1 branched-chain amino acid ABC transporter permease [Hansschlegelia plantiphila]